MKLALIVLCAFAGIAGLIIAAHFDWPLLGLASLMLIWGSAFAGIWYGDRPPGARKPVDVFDADAVREFIADTADDGNVVSITRGKRSERP